MSRRWGYILALAGAFLYAWGVYRGELTVLFTKAIQICLECVGIG